MIFDFIIIYQRIVFNSFFAVTITTFPVNSARCVPSPPSAGEGMCFVSKTELELL